MQYHSPTNLEFYTEQSLGLFGLELLRALIGENHARKTLHS